MTDSELAAMLNIKGASWTIRDLVNLSLWLNIDLSRDGGTNRALKINSYLNDGAETTLLDSHIIEQNRNISKVLQSVKYDETVIDNSFKDLQEVIYQSAMPSSNRKEKIDSAADGIKDQLNRIIGVYLSNDDIK